MIWEHMSYMWKQKEHVYFNNVLVCIPFDEITSDLFPYVCTVGSTLTLMSSSSNLLQLIRVNLVSWILKIWTTNICWVAGFVPNIVGMAFCLSLDPLLVLFSWKQSFSKWSWHIMNLEPISWFFLISLTQVSRICWLCGDLLRKKSKSNLIFSISFLWHEKRVILTWRKLFHHHLDILRNFYKLICNNTVAFHSNFLK